MAIPTKGRGGLARLGHALRYSLQRLSSAYRHEAAFRQEIFAALVMIPVAVLIEPSGIGRALMIGSVLVVLVVELFNSAIENAVDRVSLERHELAERAKDIGSAAVFVSIANVFVVWSLVLLG